MLEPFQIRRGQEDYFLCWQLADLQADAAGTNALRFSDETDALFFLRNLITDSGVMHDLRAWLLSESRSFVMYAIEDADLIVQTARMLASGDLAAATTAEGEADADAEGEGQAELDQEEGILRKSGVVAATPSTPSERTPLQDEMARREESGVAPEEVVPPEEEQPEEETPFVATVHAVPPPGLGARAEIEKSPTFESEAKGEAEPAVASEAAVEETPDVALEAEIGGVDEGPAVEIEPQPGQERLLETETTAEGSSEISAETEVKQTPHSVETETDFRKPPAVDTHLDVPKPHDDEED